MLPKPFFKKHFFQIFLLIACVVSLSFSGSNTGLRKSLREGYLTKSFRLQYPDSDELIVPDYSYDTKIWYMADFVIENNPLIQIRETANTELWRAEDLYFTFVDLAYRNYFRYASFSDTAKLLQCCYTTTDSLGIEFGWNFFYCNDIRPKNDSVLLPDTTISSVQFKRVGYYKNDTTGIKKMSSIYYLNTHRKDTTFTLSHPLTHQYQHPVTRIDYFLKNKATNKEFRLIEQINFERDTLTVFEKKIFKKWVQFSQKNPVKFSAAKDSIYTPPFSN